MYSPSTGVVDPTERVKIWHTAREHLPMSLHRAVIRFILLRITSFCWLQFLFCVFYFTSFVNEKYLASCNLLFNLQV